ncbi:hypothetical protein [Cardiobacterium valvarum]|uniref:hypothetical protein n=2 Tax=Cardiobacterium valvarum TaxID=194702 RepID=UPI000E1FFC7C
MMVILGNWFMSLILTQPVYRRGGWLDVTQAEPVKITIKVISPHITPPLMKTVMRFQHLHHKCRLWRHGAGGEGMGILSNNEMDDFSACVVHA